MVILFGNTPKEMTLPTWKPFSKLITAGIALTVLTAPSAFAETSVESDTNRNLAATGERNMAKPMIANSNTASFGNGVTLTANAWIESFHWTTCANYKTSVIMTHSPKEIKNTTKFYQIGLGSLDIKGVSAGGTRENNDTISWTNTNGAKGAYLSGNVCGGWGALYVGLDVTGYAKYNGTVRTVAAHV